MTHNIILFQMKAGWQLPVFLALMAILNPCGFYATLPSSWQHSAKFEIWHPLLSTPFPETARPTLYVYRKPSAVNMELLRLENTSRTTESDHWPSTARSTTKPRPEVPHSHIFWTLPGAACSKPWQLFQWRNFFLISNLNFPWCNLRPFLLALSPIPLVLSVFQSLQLWGWDIHDRHIPAQSWGHPWVWVELALWDPKSSTTGMDRARMLLRAKLRAAQNCL